MGSWDWHDDAACRSSTFNAFFPHETDTQGQEKAKRVCRRCPVLDACRDYALTTNQKYGIWGGLTEEERKSFRRRQQRARAAS